MATIVNYLYRLVYGQPKKGGPAATIALAEALVQDLQKLGAGGNDGIIKKGILQKVKQIGAQVGGTEMIIPGYAVAMGEIGATYIFMEWKLFDKLPDKGSISYKELASSIGADEAVISRIGGMLVATGRLIQTSSGHVAHSPSSRIFTSTHPAGNLFRVMFEHGLRPYIHWAEYFKRYGIHEPEGPTNNPFTLAWGHPEMNMWELIAMDEDRQTIFSSGMRSMNSISGKYGGPASLYDFKWVGAEATKSASLKSNGKVNGHAKSERALIVDVGGSHGATLKHIMEAVPEIPQERCVLQDRPEVIEEAIQLDDPALRRVQRMPHDFNNEQPVKGALVYLLRRVLHDYSDSYAIKILQPLSAAMGDDPRSRVLIMDQVLSDPPTPGNAAADLVMFNIGGKERSPAMFDYIAREAGLKVVKIHRQPGTEVGVVECAKI